MDRKYRVFRFSGVEVRERELSVAKEGEVFHVEPKAFRVLLFFLHNTGKLITKDELLNAVWNDAAVTDNSLTRSIALLRRVLGDDPAEPRFIATVPTVGYRFLPSVETSDDALGSLEHLRAPATENEEEAISSPPVPQITTQVLRPPAVSSPGWSLVGVALLLLLAVGLALWLRRHAFQSEASESQLTRHSSDNPLSGVAISPDEVAERQLTANSQENSVTSAAISPDGKYLAYADSTGVYLKVIRTGETHSVSLPLNFAALVDDWFPDGSSLLVTRAERGGKASLWSISLFGGSPRQLADDASGGSFSPDGAHIAFRRGDLTYEGLWGREEWVMRSDGTDQVMVTALNSDDSQLGTPTWSPDGKRIAYIRSNWAWNARTSFIELNEWQKASTEILLSDNRLSPDLHWLPDGRIIYAFGSTQHQHDSSLLAASLQQSGKISSPPTRLTGGHGWISRITGSADGKVVIFLRGNWLPSVYLGTLATDGTDLLANRRLTLDENEFGLGRLLP
jgi:DNA-binding winged helix-turn-helix (wHTH) protein